jgi:ubiquitin carboxyl-terminal hydrolase L5
MARRTPPISAANSAADTLLGSRKRCLPRPLLEQDPHTKKRKASVSPPSAPHHTVAQQIDVGAWQGFCEIESEPACFSVILRDMGVQGVLVREAFSVDPMLLATLPQPIYGLILLFRHRKFGRTNQATECPPNLWFANQLPAQNSCATLAMMNIIMNNTDIDIGEHLRQFKDFTQDLTPFQRGEAFANFDFVKKIHNSFAKIMDIFESDKHLSNKVKRAKRETNGKKERRASADSAATDDSTDSYVENAHHFIAFAPVGDEVWKFDGLDAQPALLGTFGGREGETWLSTAADTIATVMAAGDDDYNIIALTQSPLLLLRKRLVEIYHVLHYVESRLDSIDAKWETSSASIEKFPDLQMLGVNDRLTSSVADATKCKIDGEQMQQLLGHRTRLLQTSSQLATDIMIEMQSEVDENQKAAQRRFDCAPVIKKWMEMLAGNGYLERNLDQYTQRKGRK